MDIGMVQSLDYSKGVAIGGIIGDTDTTTIARMLISKAVR